MPITPVTALNAPVLAAPSSAREHQLFGAWEWNLLSGETWFSPAATAIIGASPDRLPAELNGLLARIHPDDQERVSETVDSGLARETGFEVAYRLLSGDGGVKWIESRADVVRDRQGRVARCLGMITDVTDQVGRQDALRAGERGLRNLIEALPAAIYSTDAEGRITLYNKAAVDLAGNVPELGVDKWCVTWRLWQPDGTALAHDACPMAVALKEGRSIRGVEAFAERPDGTRIPFLPYPTPLFDDTGALTGAVNMLVDITERKEDERKVEQLNARLHRAMAETHHRVKNNLQVVAAMVDIILMEASGAIDPQKIRSLGSHVRALALVHDLLTRSAKRDGEADNVSAADILSTLIPLLEQASGGRIIRTNLSDLTLSVKAATALALVTNELVQNSIKHGRRDIRVRLSAESHTARLQVMDDGPGFPPDFAPENLPTSGLELVRSLTEWDLCGAIRFENQPRGGAIVTVEMPLICAPASSD